LRFTPFLDIIPTVNTTLGLAAAACLVVSAVCYYLCLRKRTQELIEKCRRFPKEYTIGGDTAEETLIFTGDSLTEAAGIDCREESLPYLVAQQWTNRPCQVINRAVSTCRVKRLEEQLRELPEVGGPITVFIFIGCNDVIRFMRRKTYESHLSPVLQRLADKNIKIVLSTIPDPSFIPALRGGGRIFRRSAEQLTKSVYQLAEQYGALVVPLHTVKLDSKDDYSDDLYHPRGRAVRKWIPLYPTNPSIR